MSLHYLYYKKLLKIEDVEKRNPSGKIANPYFAMKQLFNTLYCINRRLKKSQRCLWHSTTKCCAVPLIAVAHLIVFTGFSHFSWADSSSDISHRMEVALASVVKEPAKENICCWPHTCSCIGPACADNARHIVCIWERQTWAGSCCHAHPQRPIRACRIPSISMVSLTSGLVVAPHGGFGLYLCSVWPPKLKLTLKVPFMPLVPYPPMAWFEMSHSLRTLSLCTERCGVSSWCFFFAGSSVTLADTTSILWEMPANSPVHEMCARLANIARLAAAISSSCETFCETMCSHMLLKIKSTFTGTS